MNREETNKKIIQAYQNDEHMMILIYAQWCMNHDIDPVLLYQQAYPNQLHNTSLADALEWTVPKYEADQIEDETVLLALQAFGNEALAFHVQQAIENRKK